VRQVFSWYLCLSVSRDNSLSDFWENYFPPPPKSQPSHFIKSYRDIIPINLDCIGTLYRDVCVFSVYFRYFVK